MPGRISSSCAPCAIASASAASSSTRICGAGVLSTRNARRARTPSFSTLASQPICRSQLAMTGARTPSASNTTMRAPRTATYWSVAWISWPPGVCCAPGKEPWAYSSALRTSHRKVLRAASSSQACTSPADTMGTPWRSASAAERCASAGRSCGAMSSP